MYIRKSIRKYGNKTYVNNVLVESVQTPKGPRQKAICSLGDLSPRPAKQWLKRNDLSADEIWRIYMTLTRAEAAFRAMKSPLSERPIFHQIQRRVETHIFLCVLAYHLLVAIENTLLERGVHTSWWTIRQMLRTHEVCTIVLPADNGKVLHIRRASKPEPDHIEVYKFLRIPAEIMSPQKFWADKKGNNSD